MTIGNRIREERERFRLSQTAFGEIGGVLKGAQINYEKGDRAPDANYLSSLSRIGVDIYYILTGERVQPPSDILEPEEKVLINAYRQLTEKSKKEILLSIIACDEDKKQKSKKKKADALVNVKGQNNNIKTVNSKKVKGGIVIK